MGNGSKVYSAITPKEQTIVNLSGKQTLVGRTSGERLLVIGKPPTKQVSVLIS
ncbi:hypothetical protein X953_10230 [Virgibacillus sp. SK37]|nr:hypothetical protein X953_10230 [Virgibacillus sp. SK37]